MTKPKKPYDTIPHLEPSIREMYSFGVVMCQRLTEKREFCILNTRFFKTCLIYSMSKKNYFLTKLIFKAYIPSKYQSKRFSPIWYVQY